MDGRRAQLLWVTIAAAVSFNEAARLRSGGANASQPCSAPDEVHDRLVKQGMALLSAGGAFVLYGIDEAGGKPAEEEEVALLFYDCLKGKELLFLHIPKNAGSSVVDLAHEHGKDWGGWKHERDQKMADGNYCPAWHVPPYLKKAPNPYTNPNADIFCVVRDPWERMRSEYSYILEHPQYFGPGFKGTHAVDGPECTVGGFNKFVIGSLEDFKRGKKYQVHCHLLPQWDYVEGPHGHQWCKHILPIKELTPRFNALMSSHGWSMRMAPYTKSNVGTHCPLLKHRTIDQLYWPYTQELMRSVYWKDFKHLGDSSRGLPATALFNSSVEVGGGSTVNASAMAKASLARAVKEHPSNAPPAA